MGHDMSTTLIRNPEPTEPAAPPSLHGPRALRLVSVLASGLPSDLGTSTAPHRYTVPVVFSRQVTAPERAKIENPDTARSLEDAAGAGPGLELAVSDRRLLVRNTNLGELKDGLAAALGEMLARLSEDLLTEQDLKAAAAEVLRAGERERFEAVSRAAAEIRFEPAPDSARRGRAAEGD